MHTAFWSSNGTGQGLNNTIIKLTAAAHAVQPQAVRVVVLKEEPSIYKWKLDEEIFDRMLEQRAQLTALMREWEDQSQEISELGVVDWDNLNATITLKDPFRHLRFQKHRRLNPARKKWLTLWLEKAVKRVVSKVCPEEEGKVCMISNLVLVPKKDQEFCAAALDGIYPTVLSQY